MTVTWTKIGTTKYVTGPDGGSTGTIDTTASGGAKLFVITVNWFGVSEPVLTDSVGGGLNTYIPKAPLSVGFINSRAYYCIPAQNSATMSWHVSGTGNVPSCYVEVWTNNTLGSILIDQYGTASYNNSTQSDIAGSLTNSAADTLGIAFYCAGTAGTITDSVFTLDQSTAYNPGVAFGGGCSSFTYSSTVAKNPTLAWTSANVIDDKTAVFFIFQGGVNSPLSVAEFEDHCVIPVDNGTSAATPLFTGNYDQSAGSPASIEIELRSVGGSIRQAYTAGTSASFGSGAWSAHFSCPAGSGYVCRVRTKNIGGTILETSSITSNVWGVSDNVGGCIGQSNLVQMNDTISSPPAAHEWARTWDGTTYAQPTGNGYIEMLNAIIAGRPGGGLGGTDIPSLITLTGLGGVGVTIGDGSPGGYWLDTTVPTYAFQLFKAKCDLLRGKITYILDCGGSTDAVLGVSYATLYAGTQTLRSNTNTHFVLSSSQLPWMVIVNGRDSNVSDTDAMWQICKDVDIDFANTETNAHFAANLGDLVQLNDYHLTGAGYGHAGHRVAQSILKLLGAQTYDGATVKISYAKRVLASADITIIPNLNGGTVLNYADGSTVGAGQVAWQASKDSFTSTLTISSTTFSANNIVLTLSGAPANGDNVQVRYFYGKQGSVDLSKVDYNNSFPTSDSLQVSLLPSSSQSPTDVQIETQVSLTGVSGAGSVGSFTPTVSIDTNVNLTGVSGAGSVGSFTVTSATNTNVNLTGVFGTGSVGAFSIHAGGLVAPPALYWYQLYAGMYEPLYAEQLESSVRQLCLLYDVTPPTAVWYNPITGSLVSDWLFEIDTAVRALCVILSIPPPSEPVTNQTYGTLTPKYAADLDASVRGLCAAS